MTEGCALFTWGKGEPDSDDSGSQVPCCPGHAYLRNRLMGARRTRGQTRGVLRGVRLLERAMREGEKEEQLRESERVY